MDLVLLDGGINDVSVDEIVSPIADSDLGALTRQHCLNDMKALLRKVTHKYPNATVVVTGYFRIVSEASDLPYLDALLVALGMLSSTILAAAVAGGVSDHQKDIMESRCKTFASESVKYLKQAVDEIKAENALLGLNTKLFVAIPQFDDQNAVFAPDSWLWGIEADFGPADDYQLGGVEETRNDACNLVQSREPGRTNMTRCVRASVGHPNKAGAAEYAMAIKAVLV